MHAKASLFLAAAAMLAAPASAAAEVVGAAGAVNVTTTGEAPGGPRKVIEIGAQVVRNQRIDTSASGSMQVMFIDKTSLNIGANSTIVIDEYVYNPADKTGAMALRLGKGLLRVVGGQVTHTGGATVKTPTATIGIRGGVATVRHCSGGGCETQGTRAILHFGRMLVRSNELGGEQGTREILRPGFGVTVGAPNLPPSPILRVGQGEIFDVNTRLTSRPTQHGGTSAIPSDAGASRLGVGNVAGIDPPSVTSRQPQTSAGDRSATAGAGAPQPVQTAQTAAQFAQQASASQTLANAATSAPAPAPAQRVYAPQAFVLTTTVDPALGQTSYPYIAASFVTNGGTQVATPIYGYRAGGTSNASNVMQANLIVTGQGPTQSSTVSLMTGQIANSPNFGPTLSGVYAGATNRTGWADGPIASAPSSIAVDANGLPTGSFPTTNANWFSTATDTYNPVGPIPPGSGFTQTVSAGGAAPSGLGADHPDRQLEGYSANLMHTARFVATSNLAPAVTDRFIVAGKTTVALVGDAGRMGAVFDLRGAATMNGVSWGPNGQLQAVPPPYLGADAGLQANTPADMNLRFGSTATGTDATMSAYIDANRFGALMEWQQGPNAMVQTSSVNGRVLNAPGVTNSTPGDYLISLMVSADTVGANSTGFLSSLSNATVVPCACDYTKWGFWTASIGQNDAGSNSVYSTVSGIGTWVAGVPARAADLPVTGQATYVGQAVATIAQPGSAYGTNSYLAAGTFTNTVNFGTNSGFVTIANLDSTTYTGVVNIVPTTTFFAGALSGSTGGRFMNLGGSFYQGGPTNISPAYGEMGGAFGISSTVDAYKGAGTFTARRVN
jgi:hypothetical protein